MRSSSGPGSMSSCACCRKGGASFILALKEEKSIAEAGAIAFGQASGFDLQANLAELIAAGAIIGIRPGRDPKT
jgi:hypothetical protein